MGMELLVIICCCSHLGIIGYNMGYKSYINLALTCVANWLNTVHLGYMYLACHALMLYQPPIE